MVKKEQNNSWVAENKLPGGVLSPKSYVDVPAGPRKSNYLYTNFLPNFPPISIPFSKEKHPIWIKLGAFYNNLPKMHPIYVISGSFVSDENPLIAIPNFAKKCPKRQAHIRIPCQCENSPPPGINWAWNMESSMYSCTFLTWSYLRTNREYAVIIEYMTPYRYRGSKLDCTM